MNQLKQIGYHIDQYGINWCFDIWNIVVKLTWHKSLFHKQEFDSWITFKTKLTLDYFKYNFKRFKTK